MEFQTITAASNGANDGGFSVRTLLHINIGEWTQRSELIRLDVCINAPINAVVDGHAEALLTCLL